MKILVVSAHPDDVEIACAGTLRKYQEQGADIVSVLTVKPSAEVNVNRNRELVQNELEASYNYSQWKLKIFNTPLHKNARPNLTVDNNTITSLNDLLESCDIAIIPNPQDSHQDHKNTYNLVWPYVKRHARQTWLMNQWPYCHDHQQSPNHYVEISPYWNFKQDLLKCYSSYLTDDDIKKIYVTNQYWAQKNKQSVAEAFTIVNSYE